MPGLLLTAPHWSRRQNGIVVDACIAKTVILLWSNRVVTLGCCCGHNRMQPSVVIGDAEDGNRVTTLLNKYDKRSWSVMQWVAGKLVDLTERRLSYERRR